MRIAILCVTCLLLTAVVQAQGIGPGPMGPGLEPGPMGPGPRVPGPAPTGTGARPTPAPGAAPAPKLAPAAAPAKLAPTTMPAKGPDFDAVELCTLDNNSGDLAFGTDKRHVAFVKSLPARTGGQARSAVIVDTEVVWEGEGMERSSLRLGADGKHVAFKIVGAGKQSVFFDGVEGPAFRSTTAPKLSPDGKHVMYIGTMDDATAACVCVVDHVPGQPFARIEGEAFSPDSQHHTYLGSGKDNTRQAFVLDNTILEQTKVERFQFSPDGRHYGYVIAAEGRAQVIIDGKRQPEYLAIKDLWVGNNGHFAYWAVYEKTTGAGPSAQKTPRNAVIYDGKELQTITVTAEFRFDATREHMAFLGKMGPAGKEINAVCVDGKVFPLGNATVEDISFGPAGKSWACVLTEGDKQSVCFNGVKGVPFKSIPALTRSAANAPGNSAPGMGLGLPGEVVDRDDPARQPATPSRLVFSPDEKHIAYAAIAKERPAVIVDGRAWPEVSAVDDIRFTPDGKHAVAKVQIDRDELLLADGKPLPFQGKVTTWALSSDSLGAAWTCVYQPDFVGDAPRGMLLINGKASPADGAAAKMIWSDDGKHVLSVHANQLVVDGVLAGPTYDAIISPYMHNGWATYFAKQGNTLLAVRQKIPEKAVEPLWQQPTTQPGPATRKSVD